MTNEEAVVNKLRNYIDFDAMSYMDHKVEFWSWFMEHKFVKIDKITSNSNNPDECRVFYNFLIAYKFSDRLVDEHDGFRKTTVPMSVQHMTILSKYFELLDNQTQ